MLALRLIRGARPTAQLRRLLVALAAGGVGFLLLGALGYALDHPGDPGPALVRLLWCLIPLAAVVQLAVAVARRDPGAEQRAGLDAAGLGPAGLVRLAAVSTAVSMLLGSALALLVFLHLRGDVTGMPFDGSAGDGLAARRDLPVPATLTLLLLPPTAAVVATARALRAGPPAAGADGGRRRQGVPVTLPWGAALVATGLTVEGYAARDLPAGAGPSEGMVTGVLAGWLLIAAGLVLAGPAVTELAGRLLTAWRPGAVRLLAGRVLLADAGRLGGPVGVLTAVAWSALTAALLYGAELLGPFTVLGALVVVGCSVGTVWVTAGRGREERVATSDGLRDLGASVGLLRRAAALRVAVPALLLLPLVLAVARLATLPLAG
ncbi:hypothetical protein GL263_00520 [Streptomyces durbertensis]|uniref:Integral membrane protein n=1 Tax=Streptomyces durbertensis TaxID=2448886 RepID=A0ABR6EA98_9ACTN|nr:hypothetical protein [Streptomyces durbertensis]MBB1242068.1 hypothetical protein [Streptomyces durbertensis]